MAEAALKPEKDFSKETNNVLAEADKLAKAALDKLMVLEKQTRLASDLPSTSRILIAAVDLCRNAKDWPLLNEQVLLLSKKHSQLKQAITKMVQHVMGLLGGAPTLDIKLAAIETLRTVTEGKIFVEVERARVTKMLADIRRQQGDVKAAAAVLCELQVETFGSMARREKVQFILDQVTLCIETTDWQQAAILARKISTKYLARMGKAKDAKGAKDAKEDDDVKDDKEEEEPAVAKPDGDKADKPAADASSGKDKAAKDDPSKPSRLDDDEADDDVTDLKLRYYEQQITLAKHDDRYLDACKHYRQVLDTSVVEDDVDKLKPVLQRIIYFIILSPHDNEQHDLLHRIFRDARNAQHVPRDAELLKLFTVNELMRWPDVAERFGRHLCESDIFSARKVDSSGDGGDDGDGDALMATITGPVASASSSSTSADKAFQRWTDLRKRVIEHNVRVVAKYYTRIHLARLAELLDLAGDEAERVLSDLVTGKTLYARIDRPAGVVSFARPRDSDEVLNEWSGKMRSLLGLLERIDHLITKEEMMANIQPGKKRK